jgi:hypothetical protein
MRRWMALSDHGQRWTNRNDPDTVGLGRAYRTQTNSQ